MVNEVKAGQTYRENGGRKLTLIAVGDNVEYVRHGERCSRITPFDWFVAERDRANGIRLVAYKGYEVIA